VLIVLRTSENKTFLPDHILNMCELNEYHNHLDHNVSSHRRIML